MNRLCKQNGCPEPANNQGATLSKKGNDECNFDEVHSELLKLMAGEEPSNSSATFSTPSITLWRIDLTISTFRLGRGGQHSYSLVSEGGWTQMRRPVWWPWYRPALCTGHLKDAPEKILNCAPVWHWYVYLWVSLHALPSQTLQCSPFEESSLEGRCPQ